MIEKAARRFNTDKYTVYCGIAILAFVLLQIIKSYFMGVHQDEANWWLAAKDLQAGYFGHPPFIAYEMFALTRLFGESPLALRLGSILFTSAAMITLFAFFKEMFEDSKWAFLTMLVALVLPATNYWLILAHQDAPFIFFWLITMLLIWKAVKGDNRKYWYYAGLTAGFMLLCKLQAVLFLVSVMLYIILSKKGRRWLTAKEPYIATGTAIAMFTPTLIWYISHDLDPIFYQLVSRPAFMPSGSAGYIMQIIKHIGWCALMMSPFVYLLCIGGIIYSGYSGFKNDKDNLKYLFLFSIPVVSIFAMTAGPPYWSLPGLLAALMAGMAFLRALVLGETLPIFKKIWKPAFAVCCLLVSFLIVCVSIFGAFTTSILHNGWEELAEEIKKAGNSMEGEKPYLAGPYHWIVNEAAYYTYFDEDRFPGYTLMFRDYENKDFGIDASYAPWVPWDKLTGKNMLFIDEKRNPDGFETPLVYWQKRLICYFERVDKPIVYICKKNGKEFRTLYIFKCYGFKGPNPGIDLTGNVREYVESRGSSSSLRRVPVGRPG